MSIDLGKLVTGVLGTAVGAAGKVLGISGVTDTIANALTGATPEQKAAIEAAVAQHDAIVLEQRKLDAAIIHDDDEVEKVEAQSADKYVSRARPTGLYVGYAVTLAISTALILKVPVPTDAILAILVPCWGHAGYYAYSRTREKLGGAA